MAEVAKKAYKLPFFHILEKENGESIFFTRYFKRHWKDLSIDILESSVAEVEKKLHYIIEKA